MLEAMEVFELDGRRKCLLMKSPANMSFSRISMLVFTPFPFSMYTTSNSLATFPVAPLAYGHPPPRPPTEESTVLIPICLINTN